MPPSDLTLQATFWPGGRVPADGHLALWGPADLVTAAAELGLPSGDPAQLPTVRPASKRASKKVVADIVPACVVPILPAVRALAALPPPDAWPSWQRPSDSVSAWSVAAKLALEHVARGHLVPAVRPAGPGCGLAYWRLAANEDGRFGSLTRAMPPAAHALQQDEDDGTVWTAADLLTAFGDAVADMCVRTPSMRPNESASFEQRLTVALSGDDPIVELPDDDLADELASWAAPVVRNGGRGAARLCVQLHTPATEEPDARWPMEFNLQAADDPSLMVPAEEVWATGSARMQVLGRQVEDPQESLVRGLAEAARLFSPIGASLSERRPVRVELDPAHAGDFLTDGAGAIAAAGIGVLLPAELTAQGARRIRARLRLGANVTDPGSGITSAGLTAEGLGGFRWEAAIGDEALTAEEFAEIVALKQPLVQWKGHWVRIDPDELPKLVDLAGTTGALSGIEALSAALAGQREATQLGTVEVTVDGPLAALVDQLRSASASHEPRLAGIDATLRDYQLRGAAWLQTMAELRLGTLLADDMGLGKTLQTIALLTGRGADRPHLVVCPTSVVSNWLHELERFAPSLPVLPHHGTTRAREPEEFKPGVVVVTSYGLLRRDAALLTAVEWDVVVLDEAQQVKNQAAQASRVARQLPAAGRVALTGTPIENRLSELWSIMEFANPGLLGPFPRFKERYAVPVERWRDTDVADRLRRVVAPFMLRRVKTEVATELPPKVEATVPCTLTREQATLYQATVRTLLDGEGLGEGIERRGRILKLLTALKQICNHPAQYLGEPGPLPGRSGKLARVTEMLAEVVATEERALLFTQYREMGDLLARHLSASLRLHEVPFLHGGVSRSRRDAMVNAFQDGSAPPVLLVSLKAGGTGLNLTAATHVIHYDRWWNPAVEDQATDRAHRIGQQRTVNVHKLVAGGTLEERIAALLEDKRALANAVVGTGETWLTEMGDDELRALIELSSDAADVEAA